MPTTKKEDAVPAARVSGHGQSGIVIAPGVILVGEGRVKVPPFSEEQVRFIDERRRLALMGRQLERVGGRNSTPQQKEGARVS